MRSPAQSKLPVAEEEDACSGFESELNEDMTEMVCDRTEHLKPSS